MKQPTTRRNTWPRRVLWLVAALWLVFPLPVLAQEGTLNYNVSPVFPQSQAQDNQSYFDLALDPGETETLSLKLQNVRQEPIELAITAHTAYTNVLGVVEYGADAKQADPTLPYSLADLIEAPEPITLAAHETKTIAIDLHMPKEAFDGFLAGGLRVSEVQEETERSTDGEGLAIRNEFSYVVAVLVSNARASVTPDLELLEVFPDQLNYRNVISANLQNFQPAFLNQLAVEATIHRAGEEAVLYEANQEMMQMAPNSNFNFPISLEGDRFRSGEYVLKMTATSGNQSWTWEREFTIEADEARALNRQDVTIDTSINWWMVGTIVSILALAGVVLYVVIQKKKQHEAKKE